MKPDHATEIRRTLTDPRKLCDALGLTKGADRQPGGGLTVCCPEHGDRTPSCSVSRGKDGTIRVHCFSCKWGGDALSLVASVHGLNLRNNFREVLLEAAQIAGLHDAVDELRGKVEWRPRELPPEPETLPDPEYPSTAEARSVWETGALPNDDAQASEHLVGRRIDPDIVAQLGLARCLPPWPVDGYPLPQWARYRGSWWPQSGHRLIVPVYTADGVMRSVRAWRIEGDAPAKRLPPAGRKATGLIMANRRALEVLKPGTTPCRLMVVEGEPDFLTAATRWLDAGVIGVISGGWTDDFAKLVPLGSEVLICTHHDPAGEKYAEHVTRTVRKRAVITRMAAA
jgi:hypothetical protein